MLGFIRVGVSFSYLEGVDWMGLHRGLEVAGWRMNGRGDWF